MACERTSKRVARLASKQMRRGNRSQRSVAASALRARRRARGRSK